jgi:hypothetical protein
MRKHCLRVIEGVLLGALFMGSALPAAPVVASSPPASTPGVAATVTCAFSHPSYSGWCRVTRGLSTGAGAKRFCSQALACLNDVRCTRTYCNATTIRGGWKLESVQTVSKER